MVCQIEVQDIKKEADTLFRDKKYYQAIEKYNEILNNYSFESRTYDSESVLYSNIAECYIKVQCWNKAKEFAEKAMIIDGLNIKARYRYALACEKIGDYDNALYHTRLLLSQIKDDTCVNKLLESLNSKMQNKINHSNIDYIITNNIANMNAIITLMENNILFTEEVPHEVKKLLELTISDLLYLIRIKDKRFYLIEKQIPENVIKIILLSLTQLDKYLLFLKNENNSNENVNFSQWYLFILYLQSKFLDIIYLLLLSYKENDNSDEQFNDTNQLIRAKIIDDTDECVCVTRGILKKILPFEKIQHLMKIHIRSGLCNQNNLPCTFDECLKSTNYGVLRTSTCLSILKCLNYLGSLNDLYSIKILDMGVSCIDSRLIAKKAINSVISLGSMYIHSKNKYSISDKIEDLLNLLKSIVAWNENGLENGLEEVEIAVRILLQIKNLSSDSMDTSLLAERFCNASLTYYLSEPIDSDLFRFGLHCLQSVFLIDRKTAKSFVIYQNYIHKLIDLSCQVTGSSLKHYLIVFDVLINCIESSELRTEALKSNIINRLGKAYLKCPNEPNDISHKLLILNILSRISVHDEEVRRIISKEIPLCHEIIDIIFVIYKCIQSNNMKFNLIPDYNGLHVNSIQIFFECFLFLTMHGSFKDNLLEYVLKTSKDTNYTNFDNSKYNLSAMDALYSIGCYIIDKSDLISIFHFCNCIGNLLKSNKYSDIIRQNSNDCNHIQLEEDQIEALKEFYSKFPQLLQNSVNGNFDRGSEYVANQFVTIVMESNLAFSIVKIGLLKDISLNILLSVVEDLFLLTQKQENRSVLVSKGIIDVVLNALRVFIKENPQKFTKDILLCRQVIAYCCISINPMSFSYKTTLSMIPQLLNLLSSNHELYQYEAALGLTNLASKSDENRDAIFLQKGIPTIVDVATSDNPLCRASGIECLCNMAMCNMFREKIANGFYSVELQLLLAFLFEAENKRAQLAASGSLAMLTTDPRIILRLIEIQNILNITTITRELYFKEDSEYQLRIFQLYLNFLELSNIVKNENDIDNLLKSDSDRTINSMGIMQKFNLLQHEIFDIVEQFSIEPLENRNIINLLSSLKKKKL